jgi:hypothetical protein
LRGVAFGFDLFPHFLDFARRSDEDAAARNSQVRPAHEFLGAPGAVRLDHLVCGVTEQKKIQFLLGSETLQQFHRVGAGSDDDDAMLVKLLFCVTKLGRFDRSTGRVRFGKEKDHDALPLEVSQRDFSSFIRTQSKVRRFAAGLEHGVLGQVRIEAFEAYR